MTDAWTPYRLNQLELRNRFIKTATYEGMCPDGVPSDQLVEHHRRIAQGGVGMTTVAYCSVNADGRTFAEQMYMRPDVLPALQRVTDAVHSEGAAASIQLGHCGYFSKNKQVSRRRPLGPSRRLNEYGLMKGLFFSRAMTHDEIRQTADDYAQAAAHAVEAGFDAVELHLGHGYLLSQFLSPWSNRRSDEYGGSLENRMRFPLLVVDQVRAAVGPNFPILCKVNTSDGFDGGLEIHESVQVAKALEAASVDALVLSGGFTSRTPLFLLRGGRPLWEMIKVEENWLQKIGMMLFGNLIIRKYPFSENFFQDDAAAIRQAVEMPLVLLGGVSSADGVQRALDGGFPLMAMGRSLIHDPDFVQKLRDGQVARSGCIHCNRCIAEMDRNGVRCVIAGGYGA